MWPWNRHLDGDPDPTCCDCGADRATGEPCVCHLVAVAEDADVAAEELGDTDTAYRAWVAARATIRTELRWAA